MDVVLVGDMFYDEEMGRKVMTLCEKFKSLKETNQVFVGDPGRWFLENNRPQFRRLFSCVAKYELGEHCKRENNGFSHGLVWKMN